MSLFMPADPLFKTRVQNALGRHEVMRTLGIEIARLEAGEITLTMPYAAAYTQHHGLCSRRHRRYSAGQCSRGLQRAAIGRGLDNTEEVIYVGTLNKALLPGLRIGYAVVPRALLQAFVGTRYLIDRQPATLQQAVVSEFMQQGHFAAHIRRMRQLYREQRDALAETLMRRAAAQL